MLHMTSTFYDRPSAAGIILRYFVVASVAVFALLPSPSFADYFEYDCDTVVRNFLRTFRSQDRSQLAGIVRFPLRRKYPLASIRTADEFLERYDELFDREITATIVESDIVDWSGIGWRGIMLHDGIVWLDYDGSLSALNYESEEETEKRRALVEGERAELHSSLTEYDYPVLEWKTESFLIRIDYMGNASYRYAAWDVSDSHDLAPDLLLSDGSVVFEGSGGNHHYVFVNGSYVYIVDVSIIGPISPAGWLTVFKADELGPTDVRLPRYEDGRPGNLGATDATIGDTRTVKGYVLLTEDVVDPGGGHL